MSTCPSVPVSKPLDLWHSIKADMNDSYMDGWTPGGVVALIVHPADKASPVFHCHVVPSVALVQLCPELVVEGVDSWSDSLTHMTASPLTLMRHWACKTQEENHKNIGGSLSEAVRTFMSKWFITTYSHFQVRAGLSGKNDDHDIFFHIISSRSLSPFFIWNLSKSQIPNI